LFINLPSPHPRALARPFTPEVLQAKECATILSPTIVFTFGFAIESIKELGGASFKVGFHHAHVPNHHKNKQSGFTNQFWCISVSCACNLAFCFYQPKKINIIRLLAQKGAE
jgi:hypothetical protein